MAGAIEKSQDEIVLVEARDNGKTPVEAGLEMLGGKQSGHGRQQGGQAIETYTAVKNVHVNFV